MKRPELCICSSITTYPSRTRVLILQHPQEPDKDLGTARLTELSLANARLKIGLSWPNLKAAWGEDPGPLSDWGVLYLGSGIKTDAPLSPGLQLVNRRGEPGPSARFHGLVVLDGTWSQAKTLWWRNAWLLKLRRAILIPRSRSLYGKHRKEPRAECVSTIEAVAEALTELGEDPGIEQGLKRTFATLLRLA